MIRSEEPRDIGAIREINIAAFRDHPYSQQTEHLIVEALRADGALEISLVAEVDGEVVGHIAFSRATVGEATEGWYLLGPIAVLPGRQRGGIGTQLVDAGLAELRSRGAQGCALVGDPAFYGRFGFRHWGGLTCRGVPDEFVLGLPLRGTAEETTGEVVHHPAFAVTA